MESFVRFRFSLWLVVVVMPVVAALLAESWRLWGATGFGVAALTVANIAAFVIAVRHGLWLPLGIAWYGALLLFLMETKHVAISMALGWVLGWLTGWRIAVRIDASLTRSEKAPDTDTMDASRD
jgi:hypothetical protein